ncbi:type I methionyl aminopeptidase [Patescibacteria group bacterium]|nr:type I methionyl aminopeptidase [Patescibacteria group bacterium]
MSKQLNTDNLVRSSDQLKLLRKSGHISALALKKVIQAVKPGLSLMELDRIAEEEIIRLGAKPAFKTVPNYYWTTCLTLNDEVVHGIPRNTKLQEGDIVSIDLGAIYHGWYSDVAWSIQAGQKAQFNPVKEQFLKVGEKALKSAISQAVDGNRVGDISAAMQAEIEKAGYSVVKSLTGHGVGKSYHEEPEIPGFGNKNMGMLLKSGMSLAIEAIYAAGEGEVFEKEDGWTIATEDESLSGLFEMTVIIAKNQAEVITDWRQV